MTYWLVNAGTTEDPFRPPFNTNPRKRFEEWEQAQGDVHLLDREYAIEPGDVLIFRAVGSEGNKLIAIGEVTSPPERSEDPHWPVQVQRRMRIVAPSIYGAPKIRAIGTTGFQVARKISDAAGREAEALIANVH